MSPRVSGARVRLTRRMFTGAANLRAQTGIPALATQGLEAIEKSAGFVREETRILGGDTLKVYRRKDR